MTAQTRQLPNVPEPGDLVRILWNASEDTEAHWDDAYLLRFDIPGFWWTPANDKSGAIWSPWTDIASIEGPEA